MFTGIVEETGLIESITQGEKSIRLKLLAPTVGQGARLGDSIAVNGCCLTAIVIEPSEKGWRIEFDLLNETWQRTSFSQALVGQPVNLERSLPADGRLHGHFVTGHVDGTARIRVLEKRGADWLMEIVPSPASLKYLVFKGAIAIDGISLTVAEVLADAFRVWIIPHTLAVTSLHARKPSDIVNLEFDILAKYVERLLLSRG